MATVGEILKEERLIKGLQLRDIEKQTRVREKYLRAIEENNWNFFSSKIYIIGILKNYSRILGLDSKRILAFFRRDYERKEEVKFKERVSSSYLTPQSRKLLRLAIVGGVLLFLLYFVYQLKLYFSPPTLTITSPKMSAFTTENKVTVAGFTHKEATLKIVGQRIYLDENGRFAYDFPLHEGENKIVFELTGANGRKTTIERVFTKHSPK